MAKNTKNNKLRTKSRIGLTPKIALSVVALLILSFVFVRANNQLSMKSELDLIGNDLNNLSIGLENLVKSDINNREEECYRAGRKYTPEPLYCSQRLTISKTGLSEDRVISDFGKLLEETREHDSLRFISNIDVRLFDDKKRLFEHGYRQIKGGSCSAYFSAKKDDSIRDEVGFSYEFKIDCTAGNFDWRIY